MPESSTLRLTLSPSNPRLPMRPGRPRKPCPDTRAAVLNNRVYRQALQKYFSSNYRLTIIPVTSYRLFSYILTFSPFSPVSPGNPGSPMSPCTGKYMKQYFSSDNKHEHLFWRLSPSVFISSPGLLSGLAVLRLLCPLSLHPIRCYHCDPATKMSQ